MSGGGKRKIPARRFNYQTERSEAEISESVAAVLRSRQWFIFRDMPFLSAFKHLPLKGCDEPVTVHVELSYYDPRDRGVTDKPCVAVLRFKVFSETDLGCFTIEIQGETHAVTADRVAATEERLLALCRAAAHGDGGGGK